MRRHRNATLNAARAKVKEKESGNYSTVASLDNIEGDLTETAVWLILLIVIGVPILLYFGAKKLAGAVPISWYPQTIFSNFATWVDSVFNATPIQGGPIQNWADSDLGKVGAWLAAYTPSISNSNQYPAYVSASGNDPEELDTGANLGGAS